MSRKLETRNPKLSQISSQRQSFHGAPTAAAARPRGAMNSSDENCTAREEANDDCWHDEDEDESQEEEKSEGGNRSDGLVADGTGEALSDEKKRFKRVIANRNSARASYQRRKRMVNDLQSEATDLSQMNAALMAENKRLRIQVQELKQQANLLILSRSQPSGGGLGNICNLGSSTRLFDSSILGTIGGLSDLGMMGLHQGSQSHLPAPTADGQSAAAAAALLLSNAMSSVPQHQQHPFLSSNLSQNGAGANQRLQQQQESSALDLQRALLTKQYLARSLGLPPPPGGY